MGDLTLDGKVAIITGSSRGIGEGLAVEFARRGAKVVVTYTSESSSAKADNVLSRLADYKYGRSAIKVQADLRTLEGPSQAVAATLKAFPDDGITILVNNAGCEVQKRLSEATAEDLQYVYDLNVRGTMLMTQAVLPHLRRPGRIINIGSVGARAGFPGYSLYSSSKAAMEGFTRCWAAELGVDGHTVNCVNPGPVDTDMIYQINPTIVEAQKKSTPVEQRLATVDDIAQICAFLAEERSRSFKTTNRNLTVLLERRTQTRVERNHRRLSEMTPEGEHAVKNFKRKRSDHDVESD
ncbi:3-ketoacyl-acyl carrier protein reductase [Talaromyces pinophilus]|uniref:3-ketoacyl-acyl carrier protein reductase n=1 Tax=Talaromyces pinophilus TaxID=128442 RepID=A0A6V8HP61_TALPI|nr:3-ketoacyl-acyl carrier protein reductase [Talaromyces pinophilus]